MARATTSRNVTPSLWESILSPFKRSGPWAVLVLLMVVGIGYEAHQLIQLAGKSVTEYVYISGKSLDGLLRASEEGTRAHAQLQQALANVLVSSVDTKDQVVVNTEKLAQIQSMLAASIELLKTSPVGQEAQMASLKRIEVAIAELNRLIAEGQRLDAESAP